MLLVSFVAAFQAAAIPGFGWGCSSGLGLGVLLGSVVADGFGFGSVSGWGLEFGVAVFCDADLPFGCSGLVEESGGFDCPVVVGAE